MVGTFLANAASLTFGSKSGKVAQLVTIKTVDSWQSFGRSMHIVWQLGKNAPQHLKGATYGPLRTNSHVLGKDPTETRVVSCITTLQRSTSISSSIAQAPEIAPSSQNSPNIS